jgi:pimeloyl-ACP methyl ester carboxylesterase
MKILSLQNFETIGYFDNELDTDKVFVMLHGNMTSSVHLDKLISKLDKEYRVIAPDMRGFGISSYINPINSLEDLANDIIELVNMIGIDKFVLGGWSTGGGVAMEIAAKLKNRVQKLVLIESVGIKGYPIFKKNPDGTVDTNVLLKTKEEISNDHIQVIPILNAYKNKDKETLKAIWNGVIYTNNKPKDEDYERYLDDMLTQKNLVDIDYALTRFNISETHNGVIEGNGRVYDIVSDTLILQGNRDYVVPLEMGLSISNALKEKGTFYVGNWGHSPFIDDLETTMNMINQFIK